MRICSYDGTWCTEPNGTTFVTVYQILMKWGLFFVRQDNIWQTIHNLPRYRLSGVIVEDILSTFSCCQKVKDCRLVSCSWYIEDIAASYWHNVFIYHSNWKQVIWNLHSGYTRIRPHINVTIWPFGYYRSSFMSDARLYIIFSQSPRSWVWTQVATLHCGKILPC